MYMYINYTKTIYFSLTRKIFSFTDSGLPGPTLNSGQNTANRDGANSTKRGENLAQRELQE